MRRMSSMCYRYLLNQGRPGGEVRSLRVWKGWELARCVENKRAYWSLEARSAKDDFGRVVHRILVCTPKVSALLWESASPLHHNVREQRFTTRRVATSAGAFKTSKTPSVSRQRSSCNYRMVSCMLSDHEALLMRTSQYRVPNPSYEM